MSNHEKPSAPEVLEDMKVADTGEAKTGATQNPDGSVDVPQKPGKAQPGEAKGTAARQESK